MNSRVIVVAAAVLLSPLSANAQVAPSQPASPFAGSVPSAPATTEVLPLTLGSAIERALKYNLGLITLEQQAQKARGTRLQELADLMPVIDGRLLETRQTINLAAFGFTGGLFPGVPTLVGPFNLFDARLLVSQPVFDRTALNEVHRETHNADAATFDARRARDIVVLVAANLYLETVAASSRIEAVRAQVDTAQALFTLAGDLQHAGLSAQIDVLRAQVELESQRQRLIVASNDFSKKKLRLARAIGLPSSQAFNLTDAVPYSASQAMSVDDALQRAFESRADYQAAQARVQAADADRRAAGAEALPSVTVTADVGAIGPTASEAQRTFSVSGAVRVPIFDGGKRRGRVVETDAVLRERQAEADDFRQRIEAEVRSAFLDLQAADAQLHVALEIVDLANAQLTQAQDRFRAGVTSNLEVVQAQEAVASAAENRISSLYAHNVAKAELSHVMGLTEKMAMAILGGVR